SNPMVVVAGADAPFDTVKQMLDVARTNPHGLAYGSPGQGTVNHVVGEWIAVAAHVNLLHVPYAGGPATVQGIAAGDVPVGVVSPPAVYPGLVDAGKIKIMALTSEERPAFVPSSWPTLAESGLPIDATLWLGLFAPRGTPEAILSRIDQAMSEVLADDA